jgi:biotin carboxyl carrier protein
MAAIKIESEVNARVLQVNATVGDHVNEDDVLLLVESMKMEIPILAPASGVVVAVHAEAGKTIEEGQLLAELGQR